MMSKELKALKELKKRYGRLFSLNDDERCRIIENALKENEKLKKCYINELKNSAYYNNLALKYKKVLEIIKGSLHIVFDDISKSISLKVNKYQCCDYSIIFCKNQEEYDLLKEALNDERI